MSRVATMTVGVAIPVLNGARELARLLPVLAAEPGIDALHIVDSSSDEDIAGVVRTCPAARLLVIPRREFNHGATRERARRELGTDIVVLLTQDVIPEPGFLAPLVEPIRTGQAAVSYARQLPHTGADFFEAFPREFNYPAESNLRGIEDTAKHGVYTFFCSDSCAAYDNAALDGIGGFQSILTNEDYFAVARLLQGGKRISYTAESRVQHSHRYTLGEEFRRYFDTGYVRAENPWVNQLAGHAEGRGAAFAREMLGRLLRSAPWWLPYAVLQTAVKWAGFRAGYWAGARKLAPSWCRRFSSQRYYWASAYCAARVAVT